MPVGERGEGFPGPAPGDCGRKSLSSAATILLLDEPSNAMDNRTEEQFKARLAEQLDGRTLLVITHRASLLSLSTGSSCWRGGVSLPMGLVIRFCGISRGKSVLHPLSRCRAIGAVARRQLRRV